MAKNRSPPPSKNGKRTDTEASAGSQTQIDSSAFESGASPSTIPSTDGPLLGTSASKENRDRLTSAKKRRRQANQVRSRQPFWAALASTKVTVMREYEHSRSGTWSSSSHPNTEDDLEGAHLEDAFIWITHVDSSSIRFAATDFPPADDITTSGIYEARCPEVNDMDPFYIRVNGTHWATVALHRVPENSVGAALVHWRGEISGLAPGCTYTCSFVSYVTNEDVCVMGVKTSPTPDTHQGTALLSLRRG